MWCPECGGEYREGIYHCPPCDADLVETLPDRSIMESTGPLTGRRLDEELLATGPVLAGNFVTQEEAQAAIRALGEAGIAAELANRDEPFPMTIQSSEPALGVTVPPDQLTEARKILKGTGLLPVVLARFRKEEDARTALSMLESKGLDPRLATLVMDEVPREFVEDMDPYIIEVPARHEHEAGRTLLGCPMGRCEECGTRTFFGDSECKACGEPIG